MTLDMVLSWCYNGIDTVSGLCGSELASKVDLSLNLEERPMFFAPRV